MKLTPEAITAMGRATADHIRRALAPITQRLAHAERRQESSDALLEDLERRITELESAGRQQLPPDAGLQHSGRPARLEAVKR